MYNQITLVGRWTRDTEVTRSQKGTEIMRGSLAVNDSYDKEHTDYVDVTAFGKLATNTNQFTSKGSKVLVSGKLRHERWEMDGQNRSKHVVIANQIVFLDSRNDLESQNNSQQANYQQQNNYQAPQQMQQTQQQGNPFQNEGQQVDISNDSLPF